MNNQLIPRRQFLRAAGVALSLPFMESILSSTRAADPEEKPRRLLAICNNLGLVPDRFFPTETGKGYALSPYLTELAEFRDHFTVFSGVSHPGVDGSHSSDVSFLTAAPHPGGGGFRNMISLDQVIATHLGHLTRYPSLTLGVNAQEGRRGLSWTSAGVLIPCENSASHVYRKLFLQGSKEEIDRQIRKLQLGQSILDAVSLQSGELKRRINPADRDRLDQYETAVREVERRLLVAREWERRPRPKPTAPPPVDPAAPSQYMEKTQLMYQMARLAFETDSTRAITLLLDSNNSPTIAVEGAEITDGYHNLSHHGKSEKKLAQLEAIDRAHLRLLAGLFGELQKVREGAGTLLDHAMVIYGSNLGDANKHTTTNMPMLLAGGGFRHGGHLAFDRGNNYPLPNLFVSVLQRMGLETDRFATSTGTMRGLEPVG
jgi:hypothetical protein